MGTIYNITNGIIAPWWESIDFLSLFLVWACVAKKTWSEISLSLSFWRHLCHCQKLDYVSHHISIVGHKPYTMFWPWHTCIFSGGDRVIQGWRITRKRPRRPQIWSRARARSSWRRPNLSDLTLDGSYMGNHLKDNWGWIMIIWIICDLCVYCDSSHIHIHPLYQDQLFQWPLRLRTTQGVNLLFIGGRGDQATIQGGVEGDREPLLVFVSIFIYIYVYIYVYIYM